MAASQGHWLSQFSNEFNVVYSSIAPLLGSRRFIGNLEVWKIENPVSHAKFKHRHAASLQVNSWLNAKDLFAGTEKEILSSIHGGFAFPVGTKGMKFSTGKLNGIELRSSGGKTPDGNLEHSFIMCVLAVGRSSVVNASDKVEEIPLPSGYDSFYIVDNGGQKRNTNQHLYYINSSSRLCPTYYIKLTVTKDRKNSMYERLLPPVAAQYEYFDFISKKLVSSAEKAAMESGRGIHRHSQVVPLLDAVRQLSFNSTASTATKADQLNNVLDTVELKTREINSSFGREFERIEEVAKQAQADLQKRTRRKLHSLRSAEAELERQLAHCKALDAGLKSEAAATSADPQSIAAAVRYVHALQTHEVLRTDVESHVGPEIALVTDMDTSLKGQVDWRLSDESVPMGGAGTAAGGPDTSGGHSALEEVLMLHHGGSDHSVFSADGAPGEKVVTKDKQAAIDDAMLSLRKELAVLQQATGATASKAAGEDSYTNFPIPPSIATAYGGSYANAWATDAGAASNPCEEFDRSLRNILNEDQDLSNAELSLPPPPPPLALGGLSLESASSKQSSRIANKTGTKLEAATSSKKGAGGGASGTASLFGGDSSSAAPTPAVYLSIEQLMLTSEPFRATNSLLAAGERKKRQLNADPVTQKQLTGKLFANSAILHSAECTSIYFSLPFFGGQHPIPQLVHSSQRDGGLAELYRRAARFQCPSVLVVQSGEHVFGAYLSHPLRDDSIGAGSPSCFLFSTTLDLKFTFHGHNPVRRKPNTAPSAFSASENKIEFGNGDLCILGSGGRVSGGSSDLEGCFGVGLGRNTVNAKCFLAGSPQFNIDLLELWAIQ